MGWMGKWAWTLTLTATPITTPSATLTSTPTTTLTATLTVNPTTTPTATQAGEIAGPKVLEHMVDAVVYVEGERNGQHRVLRTIKNRFGSTDEVALFDMAPEGLRAVPNPSEALLRNRKAGLAEGKGIGSVVAVACGGRPMLVEIQALATPVLDAGQPSHTYVTGERGGGGGGGGEGVKQWCGGVLVIRREGVRVCACLFPSLTPSLTPPIPLIPPPPTHLHPLSFPPPGLDARRLYLTPSPIPPHPSPTHPPHPTPRPGRPPPVPHPASPAEAREGQGVRQRRDGQRRRWLRLPWRSLV